MKNIKYENIKSISDQLPFVFHHVDKIHSNTISTKHYNWHSNLEIIYCAEGIVKTFADEREYTLQKGDMAVINPQSFHGTFEHHNCIFYVLMVDPSFSHSNGIYPENNCLTEFIRSAETDKLFKDIISAFEDTSEFRIPIIRSAVLNMLVYLYRNHTQTTALNSKSYIMGASRIKDVIKFINEHYMEKLSVKIIAEHIRLSESYLSHEFSKFTGQSIVEYINLLRCKQAQKLIRGGANVTEAAKESGFDNLSYFTRTYKKHLNKLPSEDLK